VLASTASTRQTQSNLSNGLTEALLQYEANGQSFLGIPAQLASSEPDLTWRGANPACSSSQSNCMSVGSVGVAASNDNQGVILATMSTDGTCWWVARLQATPEVIASVGLPPEWHGRQERQRIDRWQSETIGAAGTYYAKMSGLGATAACSAGFPMSAPGGFNWGPSFLGAGSAG
jgi:hypothetical protein